MIKDAINKVLKKSHFEATEKGGSSSVVRGYLIHEFSAETSLPVDLQSVIHIQ